jgi:hypothetical protein
MVPILGKRAPNVSTGHCNSQLSTLIDPLSSYTVFTYTPSTGSVKALYPHSEYIVTTPSSRWVATSSGVDEEANSTTTTDAPEDADTSKIIMHFEPITSASNATDVSTTANANTTDSAAVTPAATANVTAKPEGTPVEVATMQAASRRNIIPKAVQLSRQREEADESDAPSAGSSMGDESLDDDEKGLADDLIGPVSSDTDGEDDDQPSQIFLAEVNTPADDKDEEVTSKAADVPTQPTQWDQFRNPAAAAAASPCPCLAQKVEEKA